MINTQHVLAIEARVMIFLYRGQAQRACELLAEHERALLRSGPLRMELFATIFRSLRGIVAVAAGKPPRCAEREVRALLRHDRCRAAAPMAALIRALLSRRQGQVAESIRQLQDAAEKFSAREMSLHAACARYRLGQWLGGDPGAKLQSEAAAWMAEQKIRRPQRMAEALVPGEPLMDRGRGGLAVVTWGRLASGSRDRLLWR